MKKLTMTMVTIATLMCGQLVFAAPLDPNCTAEKAAKGAATKATVGVGGRCSPAEAAKDTAKDAVGDGDKDHTTRNTMTMTMTTTITARATTTAIDGSLARGEGDDRRGCPDRCTKARRQIEEREMKIKLVCVVACERLDVSCRLGGTAADRRFGAAVPADPVGERGRTAPAGFEARAARRAQPSAERRAEHPDHPARRCRLRARRYVRRTDSHADAEPHRERRHQLQRIPHHVDLFADARGAA